MARHRIRTLWGGLLSSCSKILPKNLHSRAHTPLACNQARTLCQSSNAGLHSSMAAMERVFVSIGEELGTLDSHCQAMLKQCDELQDLSAGTHKGDPLIKEIKELLAPPLKYIDFCIERQSLLLGLLVQCEQQTREMIAVRNRMDEALSPLVVMTVLFKIESAYLPEELRDTFTTVTVEVDKLRDLVAETFTQTTEQLLLTHHTLEQVRSHLDQVYARQEREVGQKRKNIEAAFDSLDTQLAKNAERDNRMQDISNGLAVEVSKVVLGLQFQDIIKQKCDGISKDLTILETTRLLPPGANISLHEVEADMRRGTISIHEGVNRIQDQIELLEHSSLIHVADKDSDLTTDQLVQMLLDTIQDVWDIIDSVFKQTQEAHTAVKPAGEIALNLNSALTELAINMKLIALNAQIRSVQIGTGTGLEVLAARTAEISQEISLISGQTSSDLAKLQGAIAEMLGTFDEFKLKGREQLDRLEQSRAPTEQRLHALRDHTITAIHTIGTGVDAIRNSVTQLNSHLGQMDSVQEGMSKSAGMLTDLAAALGLPLKKMSVSETALQVAAPALVAAAADNEMEMFDAPNTAPAENPDGLAVPDSTPSADAKAGDKGGGNRPPPPPATSNDSNIELF